MKLNFWYEFKCIDVKVECGEAKTTYFQTFVKLFNLRSALPIFLQSLFLLLSLHVALDMLASFKESPNVGARFEKLLKLLHFVISVKNISFHVVQEEENIILSITLINCCRSRTYGFHEYL